MRCAVIKVSDETLWDNSGIVRNRFIPLAEKRKKKLYV